MLRNEGSRFSLVGTSGNGVFGGPLGGGEYGPVERVNDTFFVGEGVLAFVDAKNLGVVGVPTGVESLELTDGARDLVLSTSGAGIFLGTLRGGGGGKRDSGNGSASLPSVGTSLLPEDSKCGVE